MEQQEIIKLLDPSLQFTFTEGMTREQWLLHRKTGIGASDVGTIMGLNPFKASVQLFYEKVGTVQPSDVESMAMFVGTETEATIADWWQYWPGDEAGFVANFRAERKLRQCVQLKAFVRNPKYPWLFASLDRLILPDGSKGPGALECKNMGESIARMWEHGIPPQYVVQVQAQLLVCKLLFGELASLTGGRVLEALPFTPVKTIQKAIATQTKDFWERVEKGRAIHAQIIHARAMMNFKAVDDLTAQLDRLEPPPDGSDAYTRYLSEKYRNKTVAGERLATDQEAELAAKINKLRVKRNTIATQVQKAENELKRLMDAHTKLTFKNGGFVSFATDTNGSRRFINRFTG